MGAGVSPQGGGLLHCCLPLSMSNGVRRKTLGITPLTTARAGVGRWPRLPGRPLLQAPKAPVDACHKMPLSVCLRLLDYNRRSFDWGKGALERPVLRPSLLPFLLKKRSKDRGEMERKLGKIQKKKKKKKTKTPEELLWWGWQLCEKLRKWRWESDLSKGSGDHGPLSRLKLLHLDVHFLSFPLGSFWLYLSRMAQKWSG